MISWVRSVVNRFMTGYHCSVNSAQVTVMFGLIFIGHRSNKIYIQSAASGLVRLVADSNILVVWARLLQIRFNSDSYS